MSEIDPDQFTPKMKMLRAFSWLFMGIAIVAFYLSLRSPEDNLEYTVFALIIWGISFLFHYQLQQEKKNMKE